MGTTRDIRRKKDKDDTTMKKRDKKKPEQPVIVDSDSGNANLIKSVNESLFSPESLSCPSHHSFPLIIFIETHSEAQDKQVQDLLHNKAFAKIRVKVRKNKREQVPSENDSLYPWHDLAAKNTNNEIYHFRKTLVAAQAPVNHTYELSSAAPKQAWEKVVDKLHHSGLRYIMEYTHFLSHPGVLFIKNLSSELVGLTHDQQSITVTSGHECRFFAYLCEHSEYSSLSEIKVFANESKSAFVLAKFDNYIDADKVMVALNKLVPNEFNTDPNVPLYLNRYLNKRERGSNQPTFGPSQANAFDVVVFENLRHFFSESTPSKVAFLLQKVVQFGMEIETVYFPEEDKKFATDLRTTVAANEDFTCGDHGFVKFKPDVQLSHNVLRLLYYLSGLTWSDLVAFDIRRVRPLHETPENTASAPDGLQLTIGQFKHNQLIYKHSQNRFLSWETSSQTVFVSGPNIDSIAQNFTRAVNYQETNIYINHLPLLFHNDDVLWEAFWCQFGVIKSAKIIKPQFYRSSEDTNTRNGKIGFVFYSTFKSAIKAILLTNNRAVTVPQHGHPILIQSSFALQKSTTRTAPKGDKPFVQPFPYNKQVPMMFPGIPPVPTQYFNPYFMRNQPQLYFEPGKDRKFQRNRPRRRSEDEPQIIYGYPYYNPMQPYYYEYNYEEYE